MPTLNKYGFQVHYLKLSNPEINLAYVEEGKGEKTILFIHGLGHSALGWAKNIAVLKEQFHCIAIDLPGNGRSSGSMDFSYNMQFFASCIRDFILQKKLTSVYLTGHSMGGQISLFFAYKYPALVKGLILCAPAGIETFNSWEQSLYQNTMYFMDLISSEENSLKQSVQNSLYKLPEGTQFLVEHLIDLMKKQDRKHYRYMLEKCINSMLKEPVREYFPKIEIPVAIIFGEEDTLIPNRIIHPVSLKKLTQTVQNEFPHATLFFIPLCGHFLQWEKPKALNKIIEGFIHKIH